MTKEDLKALAEFTVACVKPQRPHYAVEVAKDYLRLLAQEEARGEVVVICVNCYEMQQPKRVFCWSCQFPLADGDYYQRVPKHEQTHEDPWMCHECGHRHQGRRLAYICIGCPCKSKLETGA